MMLCLHEDIVAILFAKSIQAITESDMIHSD